MGVGRQGVAACTRSAASGFARCSAVVLRAMLMPAPTIPHPLLDQLTKTRLEDELRPLREQLAELQEAVVNQQRSRAEAEAAGGRESRAVLDRVAKVRGNGGGV